MKRILSIIAVILFLCCVSTADVDAQRRLTGPQRGGSSGAGDPLRTPAGGGGVAAASGCPAGTYLFAWNGAHPSGTNYGCKADKSALAGTLVGGTISTNYGHDGGYGLLVGANDNYLTFSATTNEINVDTGTLWMDIYVDTADIVSATLFLLEIPNAANPGTNRIRVYAASTEQVFGLYYAGGTSQTTGGSATVITGQVYTRLAYSWDRPNGRHCILLCGTDGTGCTTWDDTDVETLDTWSTNLPDEITLGERRVGGTFTEDAWISNFYILSGYQTAHP